MGKKHVVEKTSAIAALPNEVFNVLIDVGKWNQWTPSITDISILDNDRLRIGTKIQVIQPKLSPAIWTVKEVQFNKLLTWEKASFGLRITSEHVILQGCNDTVVVLRMTYGGALAGLAYMLFHSLTDSYMTMEINGLKRACEKIHLSQRL
jgi:hypothetical protein